MKTITKITSEQAKKIYDETQTQMSEMLRKSKKLTYYSIVLMGTITWQALLSWGMVAYASGF